MVSWRTALRMVMTLAFCCAGLWGWPQEIDPLSHLGLRATKGAAAGYVEDQACATCHRELYESYQHVGMAQSFAKPGQAKEIEAFGKEFFHEPSQRYYKIIKRGNDLVFQRYLRDSAGEPINLFEEVIDWILGSGNRARSYLYQTEWGEMYTLPLGWYSEEKTWGMSPGFEDKHHMGVKRQVQRECLFCHNAFPEVPAGSDEHWQSHLFPKELPQGTGCQRCHGPGADHIRAVLSGTGIEAVRANIVNPAKLPPQERDSVCFQCHMLPAVSIIGSRRFDRLDYSFRPGEKISDYMVHVDPVEQDTKAEDRFEINHHGYRFWSSDCYQKSDGAFACITCHNPHVKPESKEFRQKVSGVCQDCHTQPETSHTFAVKASDDCVACHMPTRRTRDVVLTTMTDHRIARGPFDAKALVAPIQKSVPTLVDLHLLPFASPPEGDEGEIYRIIPTLRTLSQQDSLVALKNILQRTSYSPMTPALEMVFGLARLRNYVACEAEAKLFIQKYPNSPHGHYLLGLGILGQGRSSESVEHFLKALSLGEEPDWHYNLGLAYFRMREFDKSLKSLNQALALQPTLQQALLYKARILVRQKDINGAETALKQCLAIDPSYENAYRDLVILLRRMGKDDEATRYLDVGKKNARDPSSLLSLER